MNKIDPLPTSDRFSAFAEIAKSLGHPNRLVLLEQIASGEMSVESLAELSGLTVANASQHLQHLKRAGFVQTKRDGKHIYYRLGDGPLINILAALRDYVEFQQNTIRRVIWDSQHQHECMESISIKELLLRMSDESVILLDVRPGEEFMKGHLPGAVNIPVDDLSHRLDDLSKDARIVAYCRDPYCVMSTEAVKILQSNGLQAQRLIGGIPEWRAIGLEVEM